MLSHIFVGKDYDKTSFNTMNSIDHVFCLIEHTRPTYIIYIIRSSMIESACLVPYLQLDWAETNE